MDMLISARRMILDVGGRKIKVAVGNDMTEDRMNRVLVVGKGYLLQYVYVELVLAECFMLTIEDGLRKERCFKFVVKKLWKECRSNIRKTIRNYDSYAPNSNFNNEYAMTYYDHIKDDLSKLSDKMVRRFKKLGYGDKAEVYSNCVVLYNLLTMCVNTYEALMARLDERLGVNLMETYMDFCPVLAFTKSFDFMKAVMGNDFEGIENRAKSKTIALCFEKVRDGIFNDRTMGEAAMNATEELEAEERDIQRKCLDVSDVLNPNFPLDLLKKKKAV